MQIKEPKQVNFFIIWKKYFEQDLNTESSHDESNLQSLQSLPKKMRGTEQSTEELILLKEEIRKVISLFQLVLLLLMGF